VAQTLLSPYLLSVLAKVAGREMPLPKNERVFKPDTSWLGQLLRTRNESADPPTLLDPNPHAVPCNSGQYREQITRCLCGICKSVQRPETSDRALVMSRPGVRVPSSAL
jgi:hypothetical protein